LYRKPAECQRRSKIEDGGLRIEEETATWLSSILDLQSSILNSKTRALDKAEPVYYEESTLSRSGDFSLKPVLTIA
jgi:hypothetical protein